MGAGAYVCGEESALIESILGQRGEPGLNRLSPVSGLNWKPSIVNNVETLPISRLLFIREPNGLPESEPKVIRAPSFFHLPEM